MLRYFKVRLSRGCARSLVAAAVVGVAGVAGAARGGTLYWDVNGATPGSSNGTTADGTWGSSAWPYWSTDPTGASSTSAFINGNAAVFSAGSNATGNSSIYVDNSVQTAGFTVEEGTIAFSGIPGIDNGTSPALIMPGATLSTGGRFSHSGPLTIDGGALSGNWPAAVVLTGNGGTFSGTGSVVGPITLANGMTSGTLTKNDPGTFATKSLANTFTTLNVNQGLFVMQPSQSGSTVNDLGFGAATGTVNIADGAAISTGFISTTVSPATRSFVLASGPTGATFASNGTWLINSPISGPGSFSVGGNGFGGGQIWLAGVNTYAGRTTINDRTLTVSGGNAIPDTSGVVLNGHFSKFELIDSETIGSLAGADDATLASVSIASGKTLTAGGNNTSTVFNGSFDPLTSGNFTKVGTGTMTFGPKVGGRLGIVTINEGVIEFDGRIPVNRLMIGDNAGTADVLMLTKSLPIGSTASITVNGSAALFAAGHNLGPQYVSTVTLENGGSITGSGTTELNSPFFGSFEFKSGSASLILSGQDALNKTTDGTVTLTGLNTYTGGTNVSGGMLEVKRLHANNPVTITGGKLKVLESSPNYASGHPSGDNAFVSRPSSLTIANDGGPLGARTYNGTLDLTNNDLILDYTGASPIADIEDMVRAGFHGGDFLGNGITTSIGAIDNNFILAVADNAALAAPFGTANGGTTFSGVDVDLTSILVKFTHRVDLNLDGVVTPVDATIFGTNYDPGQPATWAIGDLDYDGVYTPNDATIFGMFYDPTLTSLPEPASMGALGLLAIGLTSRFRGNRSE